MTQGTSGDDTLLGDNGPNLIYGGDGNDLIIGDSGPDTLFGDAGDDTLVGGPDDDTLNGGAGNDVFSYSSVSNGVDSVIGGDGVDVIRGGAGDDVIRLAGLSAANGIESVDGGLGVNVIWGRNSAASGDLFDFSSIALANIGEINGRAGDDTIIGTAAADTISGGADDDVLSGGAGDDVFTYSSSINNGFDSVDGGAGFDALLGDDGDVVIRLSSFSAANSVESIDGGLGVNAIWGRNSGTTGDLLDFSATTVSNIGEINGRAGDDTIIGTAAADTISGGAHDDVLSGGAGADVLQGGSGNDLLYGELDDDSLAGDAGNDTLYGGAGNDTAVFSGDRADYQVTDLGGGAIEVTDLRVGSPDDTDILFDVENLQFADGTVTAEEALSPDAVEGAHLLKVLADGSISGDLDTVTVAVSLVTDVAHGSLTLNADGTYSYTPNIGFTGVDSFVYLDDGVERTVRIEVGLAGTGPAQLVNNLTGEAESSADLIALSGGGYLVTWVVSSSAANQGVFAQRFDAQGNEVGAEIFIPKPGNPNVSAFNPTATELADGTFVLLWQFGNANDPGLRALRYAADGTQLSVSEVDIDGGPRGERSPEITALEDGGYAVVWDRNQDFDDILVRTFDADGTPRTVALSLDAGGNNSVPVIETLPGGEFLVVWVANSGTDVVAQRFDAATGTAVVGGDAVLATAAAGQAIGTVDVAVLGSGNYVVTWSESNADGDGFGLLMRAFAPDGTPLGAAAAVNTDQAGDQLTPSVTELPGSGGNFLVTWVSSVGVLGSEIRAQAFTDHGTPLGDEFLVSVGLGGDQTNPEVVVLEDGRLAFSWSGPDDTGDGIYTRIVSLGTDLHDNLQGDGQADYLLGFGGADVLVGNDGDDVLVGGAGNDSLTGGLGADTAVFSGNFADYLVTDLGGGSYEVMDLRTGSPDGTDLLIGVETLQFADQLVDLTASVAVQGDHLLRVLADGSVSGDLDITGPPVSLVSDVTNGALTLNPDGTYSYTPNVSFTGFDSFVYESGGVERTVRIEVGLAGSGPAQLVNNLTGEAESSADLIALSGGGYLVTWVVSSSAGNQGVFAQRFDAQGNEVGAEIFIPKAGAPNVSAFNPTATELADGTFVLLWQFGNGNDPGLRALRYAADGTQLSVSEVNIDGGPRGEREPEITALEDGGYAVAWDRTDDQGNDDILVRTFDADGTPRTTALSLDVGATNKAPAILTLPGGEFLVAWVADGGTEIAGQRFDATTGQPLPGGPLTLATLALGEPAGTVDLAFLEGGRILAVWSQSNGDGDGFGLKMRTFNPDGTPATGIFGVNEATAGDQLTPSVTDLPGTGNFLVTWVTDDGVSDSGIYARAFTNNGIPVGEEFLVSAGVSGAQTNPEVVVLEDGRLAFSWSGPDDTGDGIYTRLMSLGTDLHDNLQGDGQDDYLLGFAGADVLVGNGGDDTLSGGAGADTLIGGAGNDLFVFSGESGSLFQSGDLIDGFDATGADSIDLDALLDSFAIADVDRSTRVEVQQAGTGQDAVIALDTNGDGVFNGVVATVINVTGDLDQNDLNLGTLV